MGREGHVMTHLKENSWLLVKESRHTRSVQIFWLGYLCGGYIICWDHGIDGEFSFWCSNNMVILGSSTGQLDMRVWNLGVMPGLEIDIHTSLMFKKPLQWLAWIQSLGEVYGVGRLGGWGYTLGALGPKPCKGRREILPQMWEDMVLKQE